MPTKTQVDSRINNVALPAIPHLRIRQIARQESGSYAGCAGSSMRQFNPPGCQSARYDSTPNFGEPDGWGIMQIDHSSTCNSNSGINSNPVPTKVVWNWKENIDEGVDVIKEKNDTAVRILDDIVRHYQQAGVAGFVPPPINWDFGGGIVLNVYDACAIQLYNGADNSIPLQPARRADGTTYFARSCMVYDADLTYWSFDSNSNDYVRQVISR